MEDAVVNLGSPIVPLEAYVGLEQVLLDENASTAHV